jgi:O-methyltransferase
MSSPTPAASSLVGMLRKVVRSIGFDVVRYREAASDIPPDCDAAVAETIRQVRAYTQTSPERIAALCEATRYVIAARIPGAIVECGVWRGGSMMAVIRTLLEAGDTSRELFLYDTFEGMPEPGAKDVTFSGEPASVLMREASKDDPESIWCYAPLDFVKRAIGGLGYPEEKIHFIQGKVEETIPRHSPERIALLRLDTDWYESTRHELLHLYPRLSKAGVLVIDDYGHWKGSRQAVDEWLAQAETKILLNRIDYTGRVAVKTG